jgi:hypothetical protein
MAAPPPGIRYLSDRVSKDRHILRRVHEDAAVGTRHRCAVVLDGIFNRHGVPRRLVGAALRVSPTASASPCHFGRSRRTSAACSPGRVAAAHDSTISRTRTRRTFVGWRALKAVSEPFGLSSTSFTRDTYAAVIVEGHAAADAADLVRLISRLGAWTRERRVASITYMENDQASRAVHRGSSRHNRSTLLQPMHPVDGTSPSNRTRARS